MPIASPAATPTEADVAGCSVAGALVEAIAARDFAALEATLSRTARLRALVPRGVREWDGADQIRAAFTTWFGDVEEFELVEAAIGDVGSRLHLRMRMRLQAQRLGTGWFVVEQHVYADTDTEGRIVQLALLCSGYCPESAS